MNEFSTLKVYDSKGFHYEVQVKHQPHLGISTAYYKGSIIDVLEYGKLSMPFNDDDSAWERYEEDLAEWKCRAQVDLQPKCKEYFDKMK